VRSVAGITRDYRPGAAQRSGFERSIEAITRHDPDVASAFAQTSGIALRDCLTSARQGKAWSGGTLNRNGAPLEFSFSTMSDDLRYTVEVGGPDTSPERRLARIDTLLGELGLDPGWDGIARQFPDLQRSATLTYGAWLGIRHRRAGTSGPATTFKIYAEIPNAAATTALLTDYLGAPVLPNGEAQLRLLGGTPDSDRCELYFELSQARPAVSTLTRLLARSGLAARQNDLLELIRSFHFRRDGGPDTLPEAQYGFSYSVLPGGRDPVFSIFVLPSALAGGDGYLRRELLISALGRGWSLGCYGALTRPLAQRLFQSGFHNMLTFSVGAGLALGLQVSLSPPPEFIHDD
jgi:hypothetical protein